MLNTLENRLFKLSDRTFYVLVVLLIILKNGVHPIGSEWISWVYASGKSFPNPTNYLSYSFIPLFISKLFSFPSYLIWWLIFSTFTLLFYFAVFHIIRNIGKVSFKKYTIVFFAFTLSVSPLYYIGHYDLFTISAGVLAATTRSKYLIVIAAFLAVGANPEQAMMTSLCVLIFSLGSKKELDKFIARSWLLISVASYFTIRILIGQGNDGSRIKIILNQMKDVSLDSFGKLNFIIFSVFGVGWIIIILGISQIRKSPKFNLVVFGSIVMPVIFAILILDRTRVGVAIGTLPILLLLKYISSQINIGNIPNRFFFYLLITLLFIPQVFIDFDGALRLPYAEFIRHFLV
jgi:hypothetical protein